MSETYTTGQTAEVIKTDPGLLERWATRRILSKGPRSPGHGRRRYTAEQVVGFGWIVALVNYGLPPSEAGQIVQAMDLASQFAGRTGLTVVRENSTPDEGELVEDIQFVGNDYYEAAVVDADALPRVFAAAGGPVIVIDAAAIERTIREKLDELSADG